ncbi:UV DNA damage repair endonuclease UvsE [Tindallia californiensis]|uniref:UV-damage endonuclease n=1 Tax=Tindallia californiensis TaxID=159292 RepID=A0A1H3LNE5_9FIRM|nr:UV DNA damage repair endonuclease UvsE [Tindallia californiensis]SDY65931.1 UV-damage endonuclease [Tindallia californiensis]
MSIELGYACLNTSIPMKMKSLRLKTYQERGASYLKELILHNLNYVMTCLEWNQAHQIFFFRVSSDLVPLATHEAMTYTWQEDEEIRKACKKIKEYAKLHSMRLSMHPGQYTLLNSPKEEVVKRSVEDLEYHHQMAEMLGVRDLIIHVGGVYGDKKQALHRWVKTYEKLPEGIKSKLRLENDEKSYSIQEVLGIWETTGIPLVLDFHHHRILSSMETGVALERVVKTWEGIDDPKIHLSSGRKDEKDPKHDDLIRQIDYEWVCGYVDQCFRKDQKIYLMLEAKQKEQAILHLRKRT